MFSNTGKIEKIDYIYTALFHINIVVAVYINLLWLIPGLLSRKKILLYILSVTLVIVGSAELNIIFFDKLVDYVLPGYYFISYYEFTDIIKFVTVYVVITSLIKLAKSWFKLSETNKRLTELQKEKTEIELKALRAQVNPHFLFNSLNVLYSLVLKKSDESPKAIIMLSDILRYVIYESNKDFVRLRGEVKLINDYISLQRYRVDDNSDIQFTSDLKEKNLKIAPMLFLPLIENSFKHGIKGDTGKTYVNISLVGERSYIQFEIDNNKGFVEQLEKDKHSGIGLTNIKNRLNLLYPGKHELEINDDNEVFRIKLVIRYED